MTLRSDTRQALFDLAQAMSAGQQCPESPLESLVMIGPRVEPEGASEDQMKGVCLTGLHADLYMRTRHLLEQDEGVEHLNSNTLQEALSDFVCGLYSSPSSNSGYLRQRVNEFVETVARPLMQYEVAFSIDHITFGTKIFTLGEVQFQEFTEDLARDWGFLDTVERDDAFLNRALGKAMGLVTVYAGSREKAVERCRQLFDRALNTFRVCCSSLVLGAFNDESLLQSRGELYMTRNKSQGWLGTGWHRNFSPLPLHLNEAAAITIAESISRLQPLYNETISGSLRDALLRCLEWTGTSTTREQYDHKIVDLSTALESVLTTRSDGRKGEAIALRYMLLSIAVNESFLHPGDLYRLYELRSRVVHGSGVGVCRKADYYTLRSAAHNTISYTIAFCATQESINRPHDLIRLLESPDRLQAAVAWLGNSGDADTEKVLTYAKGRLNGQS